MSLLANDSELMFLNFASKTSNDLVLKLFNSRKHIPTILFAGTDTTEITLVCRAVKYFRNIQVPRTFGSTDLILWITLSIVIWIFI